MTVKDIDLQRVLHIYTVETLYAAVVEGDVEWRTALVEAVVRAELSGAATMHPAGHELCVRRLAHLLQLASSYREARKWSCECHYCRLLAGVRNYLAHPLGARSCRLRDIGGRLVERGRDGGPAGQRRRRR